MGVNWKRGLFRAWVVVSVAWLILAGIFFGSSAFGPLPELPEPGTIAKAVNIVRADRDGLYFIPDEKEMEYKEALRRGLLNAIRPVAGKQNEMEFVLQDQTVITGVPSNIDAKEIDRRIRRFYEDRRSKEFVKRVETTSGLLFIPPLALLVVGIGTYWVVLGFRKSI